MQQLTVCRWPGRVVPVAPGLYVIVVATAPQREIARQQVRLALRELLAQVSGCALSSISIDNRRGQAPQLSIAGLAQSYGCSFSYAGNSALAALYLHGTVGVDMMLPSEMPDWQVVARDYLGPAAAATLAATPPAQRARAFSKAWCALEAGLKCRGEALGEWRAGRSPAALQASLAIPPYSTLTSAHLPPASPSVSAAFTSDTPSGHLVWQARI